MLTASRLLHEHHGSPPMTICGALPEGERCWVCAAPAARGVERVRWMGASFVGQNRARCADARHVCESCAWAMTGKPPDTLRMWSHLWSADLGYLRVNKGSKGAMRAWLRAPKPGAWFAAIADSGQKHVVPWAPVNVGSRGGRVLFEEQLVLLPDARGWQLVDDLADLLTAGASKEDVGRGDYGPFAWARCAEHIRAFEERWGGLRGGAWWSLALWLAQRDEEAVAARQAAEKATAAAAKEAQREARRTGQGKAQDADRRGAARPARGVPRDARVQPAEALGPAAGPDARRSANVREPRGVDDKDGARPSARVAESGQLALFARPRA